MGSSFRPSFSGVPSWNSGWDSGFQHNGAGPRPHDGQPFDILKWHEPIVSCIRFFLDHSQHEHGVQMLATFINIQLPCQRLQHPIYSSRSNTPAGASSQYASTSRSGPGSSQMPPHPPQNIPSLIPYIRRLVVTGFDTPEVLNGFFGEDWQTGVGPIHQAERRNYLFAAKSGSWVDVKTQYDMPDGQLVPFLKPLHNVSEREIIDAESQWSEWLAMQDWMVGPRSPDVAQGTPAVIIKTEEA